VVVLLFLAAAALAVLGFTRRRRYWSASPDTGGDWEGDDPTGVREPRRPLPSGSAAATVAVPEAPSQEITARGRELEEPR
jgi:hypothetical protein